MSFLAQKLIWRKTKLLPDEKSRGRVEVRHILFLILPLTLGGLRHVLLNPKTDLEKNKTATG